MAPGCHVKQQRAQACAVRQRLVPRGPQPVTTWRAQVPPTLRFVFEGELPSYLLAKDLILQVIGEISVAGGTYKAMEFTGPVVDAMTMEDRMMLCNMASRPAARTARPRLCAGRECAGGRGSTQQPIQRGTCLVLRARASLGGGPSLSAV